MSSLYLTNTIYCRECGKEFDADFFKVIDVTSDPELKEKVMSGAIYKFECPFCHKIHYIVHPLCYVDHDRKFMIDQGTMGSLIEHSVINKNTSYEGLIDIPSDYQSLGATSYSDLISKIVMLDNGLDYRIGTIYELIALSQFNHVLEQKDNTVEGVEAFIDYDDDGKLCTKIKMHKIKEPELYKFFCFPFEQEMYDAIKHDFINKVDEVYHYFFDHDSAAKLLCTSKEDAEIDKNTSIEIVVVELTDGDKSMAYVPKFNEGKYKVNDLVVTMNDKDVAKGTIISICHMNRYELPHLLENIPSVAWMARDVELVTTKDSSEAIDNARLISEIRKGKEKFDFNYTLLFKADVIATFITLPKFPFQIYPPTVKIGGEIPTDELITFFTGTFIDDKQYFNVYLSQDECNISREQSKAIYNFETLVDFVLNRPERFSGIVINPDSDKVVLDLSRLLWYRRNLILFRPTKMRRILMELKPEEINYLSKFYYELMCKIYLTDTNVKKLMEEMGKSQEEVEDMLTEGNRLLTNIIWCNYQFDVR